VKQLSDFTAKNIVSKFDGIESPMQKNSGIYFLPHLVVTL